VRVCTTVQCTSPGGPHTRRIATTAFLPNDSSPHNDRPTTATDTNIDAAAATAATTAVVTRATRASYAAARLTYVEVAGTASFRREKDERKTRERREKDERKMKGGGTMCEEMCGGGVVMCEEV